MPEALQVSAGFRRLRDQSWGVQVHSEEDLTGQLVRVERRDGAFSTVRLTRLVARYQNARRPALYACEDVRRRHMNGVPAPQPSVENVAIPGDEAAETRSLVSLAAAFDPPAVVEDEADAAAVAEHAEDGKPRATVAISGSSGMDADRRVAVEDAYRAVTHALGFKLNTIVFR